MRQTSTGYKHKLTYYTGVFRLRTGASLPQVTLSAVQAAVVKVGWNARWQRRRKFAGLNHQATRTRTLWRYDYQYKPRVL